MSSSTDITSQVSRFASSIPSRISTAASCLSDLATSAMGQYGTYFTPVQSAIIAGAVGGTSVLAYGLYKLLQTSKTVVTKENDMTNTEHPPTISRTTHDPPALQAEDPTVEVATGQSVTDQPGNGGRLSFLFWPCKDEKGEVGLEIHHSILRLDEASKESLADAFFKNRSEILLDKTSDAARKWPDFEAEVERRFGISGKIRPGDSVHAIYTRDSDAEIQAAWEKLEAQAGRSSHVASR